ncbi:MAG: 50S ribosome-binding GTPase, partial [Elusimicrobia bacterium]|nr:50S ribosome-binding GTPase [Elusimicrobiota bacterium]
EIAKLRAPILELVVRIEANLDHPEEDLPPLAEPDFSAAANAASKSISVLADTFERGRLIREGAKIAIVGRPNAGKSSLLNALLGRERAIVCAEPGTTRDTLEESADMKGIPTILIDTAGLREESVDPAERIGMERSERALMDSDIALLVIDGSREFSVEDRRVHERILRNAAEQGRRLVSVLSKADLPVRAADLAVDPIRVSTKSKQGLEELVREIGAALSERNGGEPVLVTSARHLRSLLKASEALDEAGAECSRRPGRWEDRAASRLREALAALDEIAGPAAPDEVLAEIFSRFCVGK